MERYRQTGSPRKGYFQVKMGGVDEFVQSEASDVVISLHGATKVTLAVMRKPVRHVFVAKKQLT